MYEDLRQHTYRNLHPFDCRDGPPLACPWRWHDFHRRFEIEPELRRAEKQLSGEDFAVLREVLLTMDRLSPSDCTKELFARLSRAAEHRLQLVSTYAISALVALSPSQSDAADRLIELSNHRIVKTRLRVVQWLNAQMPRDRAIELLTPRLEDRSANVRKFAAQNCLLLNLIDMLPDLRTRLSIDSDDEVLRGLKYAIACLADGYEVRRLSSGEWRLSIRDENGIFIPDNLRWSEKPSRLEVEQVVHKEREKRRHERERFAARRRSYGLINSQTGNVVAASMGLPFGGLR